MPPKTFYEVKTTHYLFKKENTPEERVRQWLLLELLSTYAIHINDIRVEEPVKVGTVDYRADIVVYQSDRPYIVIECKKNGDNKQKKGLEQSISYANYLEAKFAVYSNGKEWKVKRFLDGSWHNVPDMPVFSKSISTKNLGEFSKNYNNIMPLLYWSYKPIPADMKKYIYHMFQKFFMERYWYCDSSQSLLICESADDFFNLPKTQPELNIRVKIVNSKLSIATLMKKAGIHINLF